MESTDIFWVLCGRKVRISDQEYHPETMRETPKTRVFCGALWEYRDTIFYVATKQSAIGSIARKDKS